MAERTARHSPLSRRSASVRTLIPGGQVTVLGLGRFGGALASELVRLGYDVLGVDSDESRVEQYLRRITHVVTADISAPEVLRQLGIHEMSHAVVAVGSDGICWVDSSGAPPEPCRSGAAFSLCSAPPSSEPVVWYCHVDGS